MKKFLRFVLSLCLIAACIFGLLSAYAGVQDVLNIKAYKEDDLARAQDGLEQARDGIAQLKENEQTYLDGVDTYTEGLAAYADGQARLADGAVQLQDGEAQLAAGRQQIAENTEAYNRGKALLEQIDPIMPYVQQYIQWRDSGLASAPGFSTFQEWFVSVVAPIIGSVGLEVPSDVTDFPGWFNAYVEDGHAQLKQYEDGLVQIEEGEARLAQGYADYADGQAQLADGAAQLADGDRRLSVYEQGELQLMDGMNEFLASMGEVSRRKGEVVVPSLLELLGGEFQPYVLNEDGSIKTVRGFKHVDLDSCSRLCDEADHYLELQGQQTPKELYSRLATNLCLALGSIFGLVAGLLGILSIFRCRKKTGFVWGVIAACFAVAGNIIGLIFKYHNLLLSPRDADKVYTYHGDQQMWALILLAVAAILFCIMAKMAKKCAKKSGEKKTGSAAPVTEEAAPAAEAALSSAGPSETGTAGFEPRFDFDRTILKDALEDPDFVDTLTARFPTILENPAIKLVQNKTLQEVFDFIPAKKIPQEAKDECRAAILAIPAGTAAAAGFRPRFDFDSTILKDALEDPDFVDTLVSHFPEILQNPAIKLVQNKTLQQIFDLIPDSKIPQQAKDACKKALLAIPAKD